MTLLRMSPEIRIWRGPPAFVLSERLSACAWIALFRLQSVWHRLRRPGGPTTVQRLSPQPVRRDHTVGTGWAVFRPLDRRYPL